MILAGAIITIIGFSMLWLTPYTGGIVMLVGLTIIWVSEDQRIKRKNQRKKIEEETEEEFDFLKYDEPTSAKSFELATLVYGSLKPYETWLLELTNEFESWYSRDRDGALEEINNSSKGQFKNLFSSSDKYKKICEFLKRDVISEIVEDLSKEEELIAEGSKVLKPSFDEMLSDYDMEEWLRQRLNKYSSEGFERTLIMKNIKTEAYNELNKEITISCVNQEWIINGKIKIKL
jgi:hypothetical protein